MKQHQWIDNGSFQWGAAGLPSSAAYTSYECKNCGAKIELYYNDGDTHSEAMRRNGVPNECEKAEQKLLNGNEKKIFCLIQSESGMGVSVMALCEDGHLLAGHFSSNVNWAKHDIGLTSDWKHDKYKEHCPNGYQLVWLETDEVRRQIEGKQGKLYEAYLKNQEIDKKAKEDATV